jgi:twitching motility protein PilT
VKRLSPDPELDALIRRLNSVAGTAPESAGDPASQPTDETAARGAHLGAPVVAPRWPLPVATEAAAARLSELLGTARAVHASDLLLARGTAAVQRVNGALQRVEGGPLDAEEVGALCAALVPPLRREEAERGGSVDFALNHAVAGRLRCNVHRERGGWAAAVRLLPAAVLDLAALHLPPRLAGLADLADGLVLVTGATGSGKSTTLAALAKLVLARRRVHLITIEDPVEFEHPHGEGLVEHVEIGRDAPSFAAAMRSALRQDPDVLLVGEMRDPESIAIAVTAAETGHLVLATLHTTDAAQTIMRILDSYPAAQLDAVRVQLSVSLAAIVSQQLVPRRDGQGRVPAVEILLATPGVRNLIRQTKVAQLRQQLVLERSAGMLPLDDSLAGLVRSGLIDLEEARRRAQVPEALRDFSSQSS